MGRSNTSASSFELVFGPRRGDSSLAVILAGDTPASRVQIQRLAASGDVETMLRALRELREDSFDDDLYLPLRDAVVSVSDALIAEPGWCAAALTFLSLTGLIPDRDPARTDPAFAFSCALDADELADYRRSARAAMHRDLRRGISHLRTKRHVEEWLTANGVQSALGDLAFARLHGEGGEELLKALMTEQAYGRLRQQAEAVSVTKLQDALHDEELWERMSKLLPTGPGIYDVAPEDEHDLLWGYAMAVARGLSQRRPEAIPAQIAQERESISVPARA